jgi:hypothetical protein
VASRIIIFDRGDSPLASFLEASEAHIVGHDLLLSSRLRAVSFGKLTFQT